MGEIKKIVIKSKCKLYDGATHKSKLVLRENFVSYEEVVDNPNCSIFVADYYEKYSYKVNSESFKRNFKEICKEIDKLSVRNYFSSDNYAKCAVSIQFVDKSVKSFVFYDTLETDELKELARLIKCTIAPCEAYPEWLDINELYFDSKTLKILEKIKKDEI